MTVDARLVVVDTDVWSHVYLPKAKGQPGRTWSQLLEGRSIAIATQTRAEVMFGVLVSDWGQPRRDEAQTALDRTATVPVNDDVVVAYANLGANCRRTGHALAAKDHTGDRWVAATAIAIGAPLLSGDRIFTNAPGLLLLDADADP